MQFIKTKVPNPYFILIELIHTDPGFYTQFYFAVADTLMCIKRQTH